MQSSVSHLWQFLSNISFAGTPSSVRLTVFHEREWLLGWADSHELTRSLRTETRGAGWSTNMQNKQPIEQEGICTHGTEREVMRCGPTLEIQINYLQFVCLVIRFCWSYYCLKIQGN